MTEAAIVKAVQEELRARGAWHFKTTGVATAGTPDLVGSYRGRALAWELKTPGQQPRPNQRHRLHQAAHAGADAAVVHSRAEAQERLDQIDRAIDDIRKPHAPQDVDRQRVGLLRDRRRALGVTQAELAILAGCSRVSVNLIEGGYTPKRSRIVGCIESTLADIEADRGLEPEPPAEAAA